MEESCPVCLEKGIHSKVMFWQINHDEAVLMCENVKCMFPYDNKHRDVVWKKNYKDIKEERNPKIKLADISLDNVKSSKQGCAPSDHSVDDDTKNMEEFGEDTLNGILSEINDDPIPAADYETVYEELLHCCPEYKVKAGATSKTQSNIGMTVQSIKYERYQFKSVLSPKRDSNRQAENMDKVHTNLTAVTENHTFRTIRRKPRKLTKWHAKKKSSKTGVKKYGTIDDTHTEKKENSQFNNIISTCETLVIEQNKVKMGEGYTTHDVSTHVSKNICSTNDFSIPVSDAGIDGTLVGLYSKYSCNEYSTENKTEMKPTKSQNLQVSNETPVLEVLNTFIVMCKENIPIPDLNELQRNGISMKIIKSASYDQVTSTDQFLTDITASSFEEELKSMHINQFVAEQAGTKKAVSPSTRQWKVKNWLKKCKILDESETTTNIATNAKIFKYLLQTSQEQNYVIKNIVQSPISCDKLVDLENVNTETTTPIKQLPMMDDVENIIAREYCCKNEEEKEEGDDLRMDGIQETVPPPTVTSVKSISPRVTPMNIRPRSLMRELSLEFTDDTLENKVTDNLSFGLQELQKPVLQPLSVNNKTLANLSKLSLAENVSINHVNFGIETKMFGKNRGTHKSDLKTTVQGKMSGIKEFPQRKIKYQNKSSMFLRQNGFTMKHNCNSVDKNKTVKKRKVLSPKKVQPPNKLSMVLRPKSLPPSFFTVQHTHYFVNEIKILEKKWGGKKSDAQAAVQGKMSAIKSLPPQQIMTRKKTRPPELDAKHTHNFVKENKTLYKEEEICKNDAQSTIQGKTLIEKSLPPQQIVTRKKSMTPVLGVKHTHNFVKENKTLSKEEEICKTDTQRTVQGKILTEKSLPTQQIVAQKRSRISELPVKHTRHFVKENKAISKKDETCKTNANCTVQEKMLTDKSLPIQKIVTRKKSSAPELAEKHNCNFVEENNGVGNKVSCTANSQITGGGKMFRIKSLPLQQTPPRNKSLKVIKRKSLTPHLSRKCIHNFVEENKALRKKRDTFPITPQTIALGKMLSIKPPSSKPNLYHNKFLMTLRSKTRHSCP